MRFFNYYFRYHSQISGLFCLVFCLALNSCKKEETHYYISEEFKAWGLFQKGSYWIYKNDSTFILDSVYLTGDPSVFDIPTNDSKSAPTHQEIELTLKSIFYSSCSLGVDIDGNESLGMSIFKQNTIGLIAHPPQYFTSSFLETNWTYNTLSYDTSFYIGTVKYTNVVHTKFVFTNLSKMYSFSFSKHIGLIKVIYENQDSTVSWSLVKHHIVQ
jgi:hypothetical protein